MSKSITLTYCGMQGTGPTVKAAKLDATRKIEDALNGHYTPSFVRVGNQVALLVRHPNYGWEYAILTEDNGSLRQELPFPQGGYDTVVEAKENAIAHLCGNLVTGETMFTVADLPLPAQDPARRALALDLLSHASFHRAYWHASRVLGLEDGACHNWACDHQHEFKTRTWQGESVQAACVA